MSKKLTIIDLSVSISSTASEALTTQITYMDHRESAEYRANQLGLKAEDFPDGMGLARERITLTTHAGTHLDAPWHFGPKAGG